MNRLLDIFGWKKVGIIATPEDLFIGLTGTLIDLLQKDGKQVDLKMVETTVKGKEIDMESLKALKQVMLNMKSFARIIFLFSYPEDVRNMLITALDLGMLNGEYVFVAHEFTLATMDKIYTFRPEADKYIYTGLMTIGNLEPSGQEYDAFRQRIIDALQNPRFDHLPHPPPNGSIQDVSVFAGKRT